MIPFNFKLVDDDTGDTDEERKLRDESRKILGIPDLGQRDVRACAVYTGHSLSINAEFERPITPRAGDRRAARRGGSRGRRRPGPSSPQVRTRATSDASATTPACRTDGLAMFVSGDNLRKGAALNAIQIAEELIRRRLTS